METLIKQKVSDIASSGHGIIEIKNQPNIYVLGAFPGDVIDVSIYKKLNNIWYGEIKKIYKYSKYRETKPAGYSYFQANIPWASLSQKGEHKLKQKIFKDIYLKYKNKISKSKLNKSISNIGYRNKIAYAFIENNSDKKLNFALYSRGISGEEKTEQKENILTHEVLEKIANKVLEFFNKHNLKKTDIKYLILRYSYFTNTVVIQVLFTNEIESELPIHKNDFEKFKSENKEVQGILISHSNPEIRSANTTKDFYQIGDINICESLLNKKYYYHPSLFFQIYPKAFEEIILDLRKVISKIKKHKNLKVIDLYAGIGILGISIADLVKSVLGVEHSQLSKKYALKNAEINNIQNYDFIQDSVENSLENINEANQIMIVDPVRSGLVKNICQAINKNKPEYLIYISCNPITQLRDIQRIKENYKILFIKQYNLFPKTHHIESLVILKRN